MLLYSVHVVCANFGDREQPQMLRRAYELESDDNRRAPQPQQGARSALVYSQWGRT